MTTRASVSAQSCSRFKHSSLPADTLKNENLRKAFTSKLNAALGMLEHEAYLAVFKKLESDLLPKTDGCAVADTRTPTTGSRTATRKS